MYVFERFGEYFWEIFAFIHRIFIISFLQDDIVKQSISIYHEPTKHLPIGAVCPNQRPPRGIKWEYLQSRNGEDEIWLKDDIFRIECVGWNKILLKMIDIILWNIFPAPLHFSFNFRMMQISSIPCRLRASLIKVVSLNEVDSMVPKKDMLLFIKNMYLYFF